MAKWNKIVKIMAVLALFWIIIWIVWTGLLIMFWGNQGYDSSENLSPEQYLDLQNIINTNSWTINTWSIINTWNIVPEIQTWTNNLEK